MSLNNVGVGFAFTGHDMGLSKLQTQVHQNFDKISDSLERLNGITASPRSGLNNLTSNTNQQSIQRTGAAYHSMTENLSSGLEESSGMAEMLGGSMVTAFKVVAFPIKLAAKALGGLWEGLKLGIGYMYDFGLSAGKALLGLPGKFAAFSKEALGQVRLSDTLSDKAASLGKDLRKLGVNMGMTGKDLSKFTGKSAGLAQSLDIGAEAAGKAVYSWQKSEKDLRLVGIKSAADMAKFSEVFGVEAGVLTHTLHQSTKEFGLSETATQSLIGELVNFGKKTGNVSKALETMPAMMDTMRKRAGLMGMALDKADLEKFARQTTKLASAFYDVTKDGDKATEMAKTIGDAMVGSRKEFQNMFAGTADDIPEFMKSISMIGGNAQEAFATMKQGPAEFVAGMGKMVKQAKSKLAGPGLAAAFDSMRALMDKAVGEDASAQLMSYFQNASDASLDMMTDMKPVAVDLGKLAREGFSTGRTLADSFELARNSFIRNFRSISDKDAREFVKTTSAEFARFGKEIKKIGAEDGPMGAFVHKLSEINQLGAMALIPKTLRPMTAVMGELMTQMEPVSKALDAVGLSMGDMFSVTGLLTAGGMGIGAWFMGLIAGGATASEAIEQVADGISSFVEQIPMYVGMAVDYVEGLFISIYGTAKDAATKTRWSAIWDRMVQAFGRAWESVKHVVVDIGSGIWAAFTSGLDPAQAGGSGMAQMGFVLGDGIRRAWLWVKGFVTDTVWPVARDFFGGVWGVLTGAIDPKKEGKTGAETMGAKLGEGLSYVLEVFEGIAKSIWDKGLEFLGGFWAGLTGQTGSQSKLAESGTALGEQLKEILENAWRAAKPKVTEIGQDIVSYLWSKTAPGMIEEKIWGSPQEKEASDALTAAMEKVGGAAGATLEDTIANSMGTSMKELSAQTTEFVAAAQQKALQEAAKGALQTEALFSVQDASRADKAYRKKGLEDMTAYLSDMDSLKTAWSQSFNVSNVDAISQITEALKDGTFQAKTHIMEQKGYLGDLSAAYKSTADAQKALAVVTDKMLGDTPFSKWAATATSAFDSLKNGGVSSIATLGTTISNFGKDILSTSADKVKQWATDTFNSIKGLRTDGSKELAAMAGDSLTGLIGGNLPDLGLGGLFGGKPAASKKPVKGVTPTPTGKSPTTPITPAVSERDIKRTEIDPAMLAKDVDTITKITQMAAKNLDKPTRMAVATVLEDAFEAGYKNVKEGTKSFINSKDGVATQFKAMATTITGVYSSMWLQILDMTDKSLTAIKNDTATAGQLVTTLAKTASAASAGRDLSQTRVDAEAAQAERVTRLTGTDTATAMLVEAAHWPDWYSKDYQKVAYDMRDALTGLVAVLASGGGKGGGTTSANASAVQKMELEKKVQNANLGGGV